MVQMNCRGMTMPTLLFLSRGLGERQYVLLLILTVDVLYFLLYSAQGSSLLIFSFIYELIIKMFSSIVYLYIQNPQSQMRRRLQLFLVAFIIVNILADEKIYQLKEIAEFDTKTKDGEVVRIFSLQDIPTSIRDKEWYAFLELEVAEKNFADKVYVELSTISISTRTESEQKVKCENVGQHLSDCFIGSNQINPSTEYLRVKLSLMTTFTAKMWIEIDEVKSLKINQRYLLERGVPTFSRILRLDANTLPNKFNYLICQMKALNPNQDFNEFFYFLMSKEQTPPNHYRYSEVSQSLWGKNQQGGYSFLQLQQTEYLTLTLQIVGTSLYEMRCSTVGGGQGQKQTMELQINKSYHEISLPNKVYHLKLPQNRKQNTHYSVWIQTTDMGQLSFWYIKLNNKTVKLQDLKKMSNQNNFFAQSNIVQIWLNGTHTQVEFSVRLLNQLIFTISVDEYNLDMIELKKDRPWFDSLEVNQTEHFYFTVQSKKEPEKVSFDVGMQTQNMKESSQLEFKFYYCTQRTVELCKTSVYTNDKTLRATALPKIVPKVTNYPEHTKFSFTNLLITRYEVQNKMYQSIIVVEVTAKKKEFYSLLWHPFEPLEQLKQNKIVRGYIQEKAIRTLFFNVLDIRKTQFARIDFMFEGLAQIFISTELFDFEADVLPDWQQKEIYYRFQNSITIPNLKSMKNYYVYIYGYTQGSYRLRLSLGYNEDNNEHPISYLAVGERYKSEVTLRPAQIVFIEVAVKQITYLNLQNSITLKFCYLATSQMPTSHKDILSSSNCNNFKTQNNYLVGNFNNTGKSYVAIENEQKVPVLLKITTEVQALGCFPVQMGEKQLISKLWQSKGGCIVYQISHKGEIEVSSDLSNPQMQGMTHPLVSIGHQFKWKMASNIKVIKADEIDLACKGQYDDCLLKITLEPIKQVNTTEVSFSIFVSYTDRPLMLSDGIGHPTHLTQGEVKHFKYAITLAQSILVTLKQEQYLQDYTIYAKLATMQQKFHYPTSQEYQEYMIAKDKTNMSEVFVSQKNWLIGSPNMKIAEDKIKKYCKSLVQTQCYLLLSVESSEYHRGEFTIQVTQTVHNIKLGNTQTAFLSKGDYGYYNFYNNKNDSNVLFLVSSHASICHKIGIIQGNDISKSIVMEHQSEVSLDKAKEGWYTLGVYATDDCFYSIQASSSTKQIVELNFGYGASVKLTNGEKRYFLIRNQNLDKIKVIGGIDKNLTGEMILRGMPVTDSQMSDFMKFMNGEVEVGKKNKLDYAWTHKNHLGIRSSDAKYCRECFICLEVEGVGEVSGFLAISSNNLENVLISTQAVMYDILLKEETFTWIFRYLSLDTAIDINLQAGAIKVQVFQNDAKLVMQKEIRYDRFNISNNNVTFTTNHTQAMNYISIKVTAIQNSDYSLNHYFIPKNALKPNQLLDNIEIGRPKNLVFTNNNVHCIKGKINDDPIEFVLILKDDHLTRGATVTDEQARLVSQKLVVNATVNGKEEKMKVERTKHNFLIQFQNKFGIINQNYTICFSIKNDTTIHRASLVLLGNLNYFAENQPIHIRRGANLTFMSDGRGVIQIDECQSRATLVLNTKYDGLTKSTSNLNHRRVINNYITFNYVGPVYMGAHTDDFVTLRWRNYHPVSLNGFGYDYFSASTFRLHESKNLQDLSLTIKPLIVEQQQIKNLPDILQLVYDIYIAKQQSDLYNAMNCERGQFMHFVRKITEKDNLGKELLVQLNNLQDVRKTFRDIEYVIITVKASIDVKWKNNFVENYRFYYPYQQLMLGEQKQAVDDQRVIEPKPDIYEQSNSVYTIIITIVLFLLVALVVVALIIYLRRRYKSPRLMEEDLPNVSSAFDYKDSTELPERSQKKM